MRELSRVESPDRRVEAVLAIQDGSATVSNSYVVYIVLPGRAATEGHELFVADKVKNPKLVWLEKRLLAIEYDKARIFRFSNFWQSKDIDNFNYLVELRLTSRQRRALP